jgi:hypothetical protein
MLRLSRDGDLDVLDVSFVPDAPIRDRDLEP